MKPTYLRMLSASRLGDVHVSAAFDNWVKNKPVFEGNEEG